MIRIERINSAQNGYSHGNKPGYQRRKLIENASGKSRKRKYHRKTPACGKSHQKPGYRPARSFSRITGIESYYIRHDKAYGYCKKFHSRKRHHGAEHKSRPSRLSRALLLISFIERKREKKCEKRRRKRAENAREKFVKRSARNYPRYRAYKIRKRREKNAHAYIVPYKENIFGENASRLFFRVTRHKKREKIS